MDTGYLIGVPGTVYRSLRLDFGIPSPEPSTGVSGGENISSIEVEDALYRHPAVAVAAVVAMPHEKWGETPCAFIELVQGGTASDEELERHCRSNLAGYKIPRRFVFEAIPPTGKIQKNELRKRVSG